MCASQRYIQRKREERHRKAAEEQRLQERAARQRQQKLKDLYETQRRRVEANLLLQHKQREARTKAEQAAGLHIHIHDHVSSIQYISTVQSVQYTVQYSTVQSVQ